MSLIVLPFYAGDSKLLDKNLMWYKELDGKLDHDCILAADSTVKIDGYVALAKTIFKSVRTIQYDRHEHSHWPWQQNNAFTNVAWQMSKQKEPWLWMETDAVPVKRGWIDTLFAEYYKGKKPFGGHWNPAGVFNGVAIYPPQVAKYSVRMMTAALIHNVVDGKPYQPPWDAYGSQQVEPFLHKMNHLMQHIWDVNGVCPTFPTQDSVVELVRPEVCIFHRCKDGTLIDRLKDPGRTGTKARCLVGLESVHVEIKRPAEPPPIPKSKLTASIFIVSFKGDFDWLKYLLRSIEKYCKDFLEVVVAMPQQDVEYFKNPSNAKIIGYEDGSFKSSFMGHLWAKLCADKFCKGDVVVMVDSDCIFTKPTTPAMFVTHDNRCINLCTKYSVLGKSVPWQKDTERVLGRKVEYETMRRHGNCYPIGLFQKLREHMEKVLRRPIKELLELVPNRGSKNTFEAFSEFNSCGAFGMYFMPERFQFLDTEKHKIPENTIFQFSGAHGRASAPDAQKAFAQHGLL